MVVEGLRILFHKSRVAIAQSILKILRPVFVLDKDYILQNAGNRSLVMGGHFFVGPSFFNQHYGSERLKTFQPLSLSP